MQVTGKVSMGLKGKLCKCTLFAASKMWINCIWPWPPSSDSHVTFPPASHMGQWDLGFEKTRLDLSNFSLIFSLINLALHLNITTLVEDMDIMGDRIITEAEYVSFTLFFYELTTRPSMKKYCPQIRIR